MILLPDQVIVVLDSKDALRFADPGSYTQVAYGRARTNVREAVDAALDRDPGELVEKIARELQRVEGDSLPGDMLLSHFQERARVSLDAVLAALTEQEAGNE